MNKEKLLKDGWIQINKKDPLLETFILKFPSGNVNVIQRLPGKEESEAFMCFSKDMLKDMIQDK